mgnify:CR=1 FL=1
MRPLFNQQILSSLVYEIKDLIDKDVFLANEDGIIIASTDQEKINHFHEGAYLAMKTGEKMVMTKDLTKRLLGVLEGVVIPIEVKDYRIGVVGIIGDSKIVESYARIVEKFAQLFLKNTLDQMSQEKRARNLELFIYDWLHGNLSEQQIVEQGNFFNIDVKKYRQAISLKFPFMKKYFTYEDIKTMKNEWDSNGETLFVRWGKGKIVILDSGDERTVLKEKIKSFLEKTKNIHEKNVYIGVGQILNFNDLKTSYEQAEKGCSISSIEKRIIFEEELRFEMLQYELDDKMKELFIERTIAPILNEEILLTTLDSWLANNMSIQQTAEALDIHKNTLYYRLEKIEKLTDLKVNDIDDVILLYLSNRFLKEVNSK